MQPPSPPGILENSLVTGRVGVCRERVGHSENRFRRIRPNPMTTSARHFLDRLHDNSPGHRAIQIVAFGDSVTQGAMEVGRSSPDETYHRFLQKDLEAFFPASTINVTNSGIGGETATQGLARLERDAFAHHPDLLLIAFGLNDSTLGREALPDFEKAIREMVVSAKVRGGMTIVILTPPFMASERTYRIHPHHENVAEIIIRTQTQGTLEEYAAKLREIALEEGVILADVHAAWNRLKKAGIDMNTWLANGLNHPDARGHKIAALVIWNALFTN